MALEKITTSEGLRIYVDTIPTAETAKINAIVGVGSIHEPDMLTGISHAVEHCVFLGTDAFPDAQALAEYTGINALNDNADTWYNRTCYYATGPYVEPNIRRLGELLCRATFPPEHIPNELQTIVREVRTRNDDIETVHNIAVDYALFGHPYGRSVGGFIDHINYTPEQLERYYRHHYSLSNMALVAVGNVRMEEVLRDVDRYFTGTHNKKPSTQLPRPQQIDAKVSGMILDSDDNAIVSVVAAMNKKFAKKYLENKVLYTTAADVIHSLCYERFRQDTGLSYDSAFYLDDMNDPAAWSIGGRATVDPDKIKKTRRVFADILNRPASCYTDQTIASAIGSKKGEILSRMDSTEERTSLYIENLEHNIEPVDLREIAQSVRNLSIEDVRNAINDIVEYIDLHPPITHVSGPKKAVKIAEKVFPITKIF